MQSPYRSLLLLPAVLLAPLAPPAGAAEAPGAVQTTPANATLAEKRPRPEPAAVPEVLRLASAERAAAATLEALRSEAVAGWIPLRNGFARSAPARRVDLAVLQQAARDTGAVGALVPRKSATASWFGRFVVEGAYAFRIRLRDAALPEQARIWLYAGDVQLGPFGRELLDPEGGLWLPPAPGPQVIVEVELPDREIEAAEPAFTVGEVMELVALPAETSIEPAAWTDCDVDAQCISTTTLPTIGKLREATARLSFVKDGASYLCSGGLLNDKDPTGFRPYLLTAAHCFDTQASASSLVAYFDYRTTDCDGTVPSLWEVPSVSGATLLATSPVSDFTFVELSGTPAGANWYLGWTNTTPATGGSMERVSHPLGSHQKYSASSFTGSGGIVCSGLSTDDFHYSEQYQGATAGGSSGSPVTQDYGGDPRVVGQLLGSCHLSPWDECSYSTHNLVDGAFSATYPYIKQWINDATGCTDPSGSCDGSCPTDLALAADTISGSATYRADDTITTGPALVIDGTSIELVAGRRVVLGDGTAIGGSFSAGTDAAACSP